MINQVTAIMNKLHHDIGVTFKNRNKDIDSWKKACAKFQSYVSVIDPMIDQMYKDKKLKSPEVMEFVLTFLEIDPMFFRSGYLKEDMLEKLKKSDLNDKQIQRVRKILIDAAENRGQREFRRYCRLAKVFANDTLITSLKGIAQHHQGASKSRANLMLNYINT